MIKIGGAKAPPGPPRPPLGHATDYSVSLTFSMASACRGRSFFHMTCTPGPYSPTSCHCSICGYTVYSGTRQMSCSCLGRGFSVIRIVEIITSTAVCVQPPSCLWSSYHSIKLAVLLHLHWCLCADCVPFIHVYTYPQ